MKNKANYWFEIEKALLAILYFVLPRKGMGIRNCLFRFESNDRALFARVWLLVKPRFDHLMVQSLVMYILANSTFPGHRALVIFSV